MYFIGAKLSEFIFGLDLYNIFAYAIVAAGGGGGRRANAILASYYITEKRSILHIILYYPILTDILVPRSLNKFNCVV